MLLTWFPFLYFEMTFRFNHVPQYLLNISRPFPAQWYVCTKLTESTIKSIIHLIVLAGYLILILICIVLQCVVCYCFLHLFYYTVALDIPWLHWDFLVKHIKYVMSVCLSVRLSVSVFVLSTCIIFVHACVFVM